MTTVKYFGDVNLEYGGTFYDMTDFPRVRVIRIDEPHAPGNDMEKRYLWDGEVHWDERTREEAIRICEESMTDFDGSGTLSPDDIVLAIDTYVHYWGAGFDQPVELYCGNSNAAIFRAVNREGYRLSGKRFGQWMMESA